jgi:cell wall-associated NlpC family hydrolase
MRELVVLEARKWVGTPYRHCGDILGVGVDCAMLLLRVYVDLGLVDAFDPRPYPTDWHLHRSEELYVNQLLEHTVEVDTPLPGDIAVWKAGRTFSHGGIVTSWPNIVHAYMPSGIVEEVSVLHTPLMIMGNKARPVKFYSYWGAN